MSSSLKLITGLSTGDRIPRPPPSDASVWSATIISGKRYLRQPSGATLLIALCRNCLWYDRFCNRRGDPCDLDEYTTLQFNQKCRNLWNRSPPPSHWQNPAPIGTRPHGIRSKPDGEDVRTGVATDTDVGPIADAACLPKRMSRSEKIDPFPSISTRMSLRFFSERRTTLSDKG
jgi:hypothetical protein